MLTRLCATNGEGWGWIMMIGMMLLVVVGIILLVRYFKEPGQPVNHAQAAGKTAMDILNERYARGEISDEEYQRKSERISGT